MQNFSPEATDISAPMASFGTLGAAATLVLLPPMFFLTIPAIIFSKKAKAHYKKGNTNRAMRLAKKSKRYTISAWAVAFIIALTMFLLYFISRLSLI